MKRSGKQGSSKAAGTAPEAIMESMRCPVCTELLLSPIYQCERGHNICNVCVEEVHECPLCKGDYGDTRNYFAEDLVNSMNFPCKYAEYGCPTSCLGSALKDHQENCEFQPYRCPELACQELLGQSQMAQHLEKHGFKIMDGESHIATIDIQDKHFDSKTEYNPWRIRTFGQEFYTVASRQRDKNWYFWPWVLALPKNAKKYSCEIILSSSLKEVIYRGGVNSLRVPPEDIIKSANSLVLTDQIIRALRENGKITCKVRFIQGKNWDRDVKKDKKPFLHTKKEGRKSIGKVKGTKGPLPPPTLPTVKRSQSINLTINSAMSAIKKMSKASVASSSAPSTSRPLTVIKGKTSPLASATSRKPSVSDAEQTVVLKIRDSLKCPGCSESISPPIFVCNVGHSICDACRIKLGCNCPLCRSPITGTRNFFAEELLYKTVQKCRFHTSGCDVCLPAVQIRLHEDACDFAPYECPFSTCRKVFEPNDLLEHMKTHDLTVVNDELNMSIPFPKATAAPMCAIPSILVTHGIAFYPLVLREVNGAWAFWVASSDAVNFVYELRIKKQSKLLAFQGHVMSLRLSPNQVMLRGEGLITTEKAIKNFKSNEKFEFSLKIAPIKSFGKSGISFLTPLCSGSKSDILNNSATKTELYANQGTSKDKRHRVNHDDDEDDSDEGDDSLLFARIRQRNTYAQLFADEEDDDDAFSAAGSSPGSKSTHSLKKSKSGTSVLSSADGHDDEARSLCSEELQQLQHLALETSQTSVFFSAVDCGAENSTGDTASQTKETPKSKNKESCNAEKADDEKHLSVKEDKALPAKKKSALKLKEKSSQKEITVKESPSSKKVEFSPKAQVFQTPQEQDRVNNNWMVDQGFDEVKGQVETVNVEGPSDLEVTTSASDSSLLNIPPSVKPPNAAQIPTVKSTDSLKLHSKLEVFSRSCMELKNPGNRDLMRSRMQQLSQSLLVAIEEVDEDHETEDESVKWVEIKEKGEAGDEEGSLTLDLKEISQDLIDLSSNPSLVAGENCLAMGEFQGPIEVIIKAEDKVASISLSNILKKDSVLSIHGSSSDGKLLSNFDLEIPITAAQSTEEFVEEMDTACQVGSSLMRLVAEEERGLYGSPAFKLQLSESYETVSDGIASTYNAVKNIFSGMIPVKPEIPAILDKEIASEEQIYVEPSPMARLPETY